MRISLADKCPEIAKQWHPTKNGHLTPRDISWSSNRKVWWRCKMILSHEWLATPNTRTRTGGRGCPFCSGNQASKENCFGTIFPNLVSNWHPTKNERITPHDVTAHSKHIIWWKCREGHEWRARVKDITKNKSEGCPYCSGKKVCRSNCLEHTHPVLAAEWHPSKNKIKATDVVAGSHTKVWWKCRKGHEWQAQVLARYNGNNCPICNESKGEKRIALFLDARRLKYKRQVKYSTCKSDAQKHLRFDFVISNELAIEYQGEHHYFPVYGHTKLRHFHRMQLNDEIKRKWCRSNGIKLIEIPYWDFDRIETILEAKLGSEGIA